MHFTTKDYFDDTIDDNSPLRLHAVELLEKSQINVVSPLNQELLTPLQVNRKAVVVHSEQRSFPDSIAVRDSKLKFWPSSQHLKGNVQKKNHFASNLS